MYQFKVITIIKFEIRSVASAVSKENSVMYSRSSQLSYTLNHFVSSIIWNNKDKN